MSDYIISSIHSAKKNVELIKELEDLLQEAKNGHMKCFAATAEKIDNSIIEVLIMPNSECALPLLGGLSKLIYDVNVNKEEYDRMSEDGS